MFLWILEQNEEESIKSEVHVGRQLLDYVPLQETPGADAEGPHCRSSQSGFGAQAGKSLVEEHICF